MISVSRGLDRGPAVRPPPDGEAERTGDRRRREYRARPPQHARSSSSGTARHNVAQTELVCRFRRELLRGRQLGEDEEEEVGESATIEDRRHGTADLVSDRSSRECPFCASA